MSKPQYLYHYTNIESLALILKYKTIRFSRLDLVDDLEEVETADMGSAGRFYFVSCWTEDENESIPFWYMYTKDMKGVRIKLPSNPFVEYDVEGEYVSQSFKSNFTYKEILRPDGIINSAWGDLLIPVTYTDNENLIKPTITFKDSGGNGFKLDKIGKYKRSNWSFQKEWRYMIFISPLTLEEMQMKRDDLVFERFKNGYNLDIDHYLLNIDNSKFEQMEIMLGPNTSDGEKIMVEALVNKYNPKAKIYDSKLKNKIKLK
ncbi:MAG: DUF2971 domain-containing protein [Paraclostridium sp.]